MYPVLFVGHGSPMNALANNGYTLALAKMRELCPTPKVILCISAHWMTEGTWVTHMSQPKTIHDFGGFPKELSAIQYPAPGSPQMAEVVSRALTPPAQLDDTSWGLDHGTWSVLRHMFPAHDVPVVQLSYDPRKSAAHHFALGRQLRALRDQGVFIVASGNIVHNLRKIQWEEKSPALPWAVEFDRWVAEKLKAHDTDALINDYMKSEAGRLSVPSPDHYYPLLYALGAADTSDTVKFTYEEIQNASISMRCVAWLPKTSVS